MIFKPFSLHSCREIEYLYSYRSYIYYNIILWCEFNYSLRDQSCNKQVFKHNDCYIVSVQELHRNLTHSLTE